MSALDDVARGNIQAEHELQVLRKELTVMREHLQWYADKANHTRACHAGRWIKPPVAFDRGARALFVLTQCDALHARGALSSHDKLRDVAKDGSNHGDN